MWLLNWAASSEFVSSSIPSWQILTVLAQSFRGARDLAFCLKVPLYSLLVRASSEGSGETARMRRLAWTFADRKGDNNQIRLTRPKRCFIQTSGFRELFEIFCNSGHLTVLRDVSDVTFNSYGYISFNKLNPFYIILPFTTQTIYAILTDTPVLLYIRCYP